MSSQTPDHAKLVEKSIEAYVNALEMINKLSAKYRIETFTLLLSNAWEILLKAKIVHNGGNIFYEEQPTKTISHGKCLEKMFPNERHPVRRNLEMVIDMRDDATHLTVDFIPREIMALFQTCVLNYHKHLKEWFGISLSDRVSVGMMTIVFDLKPEEMDMSDHMLRQRLGPETVTYLAQKQSEIRQEWERLGHAADFSIDFQYTLMLVKRDGDGKLTLVDDITGTRVGIIHVAKDASITHPYRRTELVARVNEILAGRLEINKYDIHCIVQAYDVCKKEDYFYEGSVPGSPKQYSEAFAQWIIHRHEVDASFFEHARQKVKGLPMQVEADIIMNATGADVLDTQEVETKSLVPSNVLGREQQ